MEVVEKINQSEAVGGGEVFFYQFKELPVNKALTQLLNGGLNQLTFLLVTVSLGCSVYIILEIRFITAVYKGSFILTFCLVKLLLVT